VMMEMGHPYSTLELASFLSTSKGNLKITSKLVIHKR
jgi:hypothetical protein